MIASGAPWASASRRSPWASRSPSPGVPPAAAEARPRAASGGDANLAITFLPKNLGNPYFDTSNAGGEEAIEEFGGTYAEVGPSEASPTSQVSFIQTAAQQGVGGLVVSANDPEAICDALNEARDAGVKVVTFDSDTNPECRDLFINQATAEGIAKVQVDLIASRSATPARSRSSRHPPTRRTRTPGSR